VHFFVPYSKQFIDPGEVSGSNGKTQGYALVRKSGPLTENGYGMFLDTQTSVESIRAIVLSRDGCLSYKKETYE